MRRIITVTILLLIGSSFFGCGWDIPSAPDEAGQTGQTGQQTTLLTPRGVTSQTGDRKVIVWWYDTGQPGVQGYVVYRSQVLDGEYEEIGRAGLEEESFTDNKVQNGITYYYAVAAFASNGQESELSYEDVEDTPRPEGTATLHDWWLNPDASGFSFMNPEAGAQNYTLPTTDIYFAVDVAEGRTYVYSDNDCLIQDLGEKGSIYDVDSAPVDGYLDLFQEITVGHVYAVYISERHYALFMVHDMVLDWVLVEEQPEEGAEEVEGEQPEVWDISQAWIEIVWAVQLQENNPELAPRKLK